MGQGSSSAKGQVVLITGCSSGGIGYCLATEFARRGCATYASARRLAAMDGLPELGIHTLQLDVTSQTSIKAAVEEIVSREGRIDVLVNNAGMGFPGPVAEISLDGVRRLYETNVFGAIAMAQAVFPHMAARRYGRILNIGSVAAYVHRPWNFPYSSSKAALHAATNVMRLEMRPFGVRVVLVAPGYIQSNIHNNIQEATETLPRGSLYKVAEPDVRNLAATANKNPRVTPTDQFASRVADVAFRNNPPWRLVMGHLSATALLASWLPVPLLDRFLWRMYGSRALDSQLRK